jgi:hypothetical protein
MTALARLIAAVEVPGVRVLVCGGRAFDDWTLLSKTLSEAACDAGCKIALIIHGGASGADAMAGRWALANDVPCMVFPADWKTHGKAAGPIRNAEMLTKGVPDCVVAMPGGRGTSDMVRKAEAAGVPIYQARQSKEGQPA